MGLIVTTIAMAGSRVSLTGGIYAYVEVAFGPYVGFLAGVLQWLTGLLAVSGVATALLDQVGALAPALGAGPVRVTILAVLFGTLAAVNARGVRAGTRVIETITVVKLIPLLLFVLIGVFFVNTDALVWPGLPDGTALGRSVLLLIFAYAGVEVAIAPSGEVKNPATTVPRAVFLALGITTALYIAIQVVAQGVLGDELSTYAAAPLAEAFGRLVGATGVMIMLLGAICSMFGYLSGDMLSSPRSLYALARDGFLPSALARIDPVRRTPATAIWAHAVLAIIFASTGTFQSLAIISNVGMLFLYLMSCGAALELSRRDVRTDAAPFTIRGGWLWPVLGAVLVLWILSTATMRELAVTGVVLMVASGIYLGKFRWTRSGQTRL